MRTSGSGATHQTFRYMDRPEAFREQLRMRVAKNEASDNLHTAH